MRFGGHETFAVREGWLHKGLMTAVNAPSHLIADDVADWLGVGKNMARSIRHWIVATGLVEVEGGMTRGKMRGFKPTELGRMIAEHDPYFLEPATWWAMHAELVMTPQHATSWDWLFNDFHAPRFERGVCVQALRRFLELDGARIPSERTLERDVACLLSTYADRIPPATTDPEEANDSPFRELGLMTHFRASGQYVVNRAVKPVPWCLLGYVVARSSEWTTGGGNGQTVDIRLSELAGMRGGPQATFCLTPETLFETLQAAEESSGGELAIAGLAGERVLRIARKMPLEWLQLHYDNVESGEALRAEA